MSQTNQSNNFIIYNISLHYDIQFYFTELCILKITQIIENINQITFYFAAEGPGCGSEDIKRECNVNCFDFFFSSVFLMDVMGGKITINLKEVH
jgi:hypothetical protein